MSRIRVLSFSMSKLGNKSQDCEDSFAWNPRNLMFAMADGASSSVFADIWARSLVETAVKVMNDISGEMGNSAMELISKARVRWYSSISWNSLPWFLKNKAVSGSYSTLLLLHLSPMASSYRFSSFAVGDTCMFIVRGTSAIESFPVTDPREFGNSPNLIWSGKGSPLPVSIRVQVPHYITKEGIAGPGDRIIMATDALAKWIMEGNSVSDLLNALQDHQEIRLFLTREINSKRMRNDDIALAEISVR